MNVKWQETWKNKIKWMVRALNQYMIFDFILISDAKYQDDCETKRWNITVDECKVTGNMET